MKTIGNLIRQNTNPKKNMTNKLQSKIRLLYHKFTWKQCLLKYSEHNTVFWYSYYALPQIKFGLFFTMSCSKVCRSLVFKNDGISHRDVSTRILRRGVMVNKIISLDQLRLVQAAGYTPLRNGYRLGIRKWNLEFES